MDGRLAGPAVQESIGRWKRNRYELTFKDLKILFSAFFQLLSVSDIDYNMSQSEKAWHVICMQNHEFPFDIVTLDPEGPDVDAVLRKIASVMEYNPDEPRFTLPVIEVEIPRDPKKRRGVTHNKGDLIVGWIWSGKDPIDIVLLPSKETVKVSPGTTIAFPNFWRPFEVKYDSKQGVLKCLMVYLPAGLRPDFPYIGC